jgi:hypothetical protein
MRNSFKLRNWEIFFFFFFSNWYYVGGYVRFETFELYFAVLLIPFGFLCNQKWFEKNGISVFVTCAGIQ